MRGVIGLAVLVAAAGCNVLAGFDDYDKVDAVASTSAGPATASAGGGGAGATAGSTGGGGAAATGGAGGAAPLVGYAITIDANDTLGEGFSLAIDVDHAAAVQQGFAEANGSNLRVFYQGTEIDRVLDPATPWNADVTRVWFAAQQVIPAATTNSDDYQLRYGEKGNPPLQDPDEVYEFFDDFDGDALGVDWTEVPFGSSMGSAMVAGGLVQVSETLSGSFGSTADRFFGIGLSLSGALIADTLVHPGSSSASTDAHLGGVMFRDGLSETAAHVSVTYSSAGAANHMSRDMVGGTTEQDTPAPMSLPAYLRLSLTSTGEARSSRSSNGVDWVNLSATAFSNSFSPSYVGIPCAAGSGGIAVAQVEWFRVRQHVANPPTVALATDPLP